MSLIVYGSCQIVPRSNLKLVTFGKILNLDIGQTDSEKDCRRGIPPFLLVLRVRFAGHYVL